jgi:hypothetical protein
MSERMISPLISIQPLSAPRRTCLFGGTTGSTRAIGSPRNVTSSGSRLFCTFFKSPMHLALNSETVRTIGVHGDKLKQWAPKLQASYDRQSRAFKRAARFNMLSVYVPMGDWENARRFLSIRNAWSAAEMAFTMDVLLAPAMERTFLYPFLQGLSGKCGPAAAAAMTNDQRVWIGNFFFDVDDFTPVRG